VPVAAFHKQARNDYNVLTRVPIQFFDSQFRWDAASGSGQNQAATAARDLRNAGESRAESRTPQPFRHDGRDVPGGDLLAELTQRFSSSVPWERPIILVTAPAGFGKSILFESLFAGLLKQFMAAKRQQQQARRPLPLLPDYMATANSPALRSMVEAFMQTEFARPMSLPTFEWMLSRGYASWILDGLDELIAQDPTFFEYIDGIVNRDDAPVKPRILICVRDSLLGSSPGLRDFIAVAHDQIDEYRLLPWDRGSVSTFARIRLQHRDERMMSVVDSRPKLLELCGTPYYAELLATQVAEDLIDDIPDDYSELTLVSDATRAIIEREYDKELLSATVVPVEELLEVMREVAVMELGDVQNRGVATSDIEELATLVLPPDIPDQDKMRFAAQISHLSLFRGAQEQNRVRFTQDVIFEHFIGVRAIHYFMSNPAQFISLLGWRPFPPDSITLRLLRNKVEELGAGDDLLVRLSGATTNPSAFRNILQTLIGLQGCANLLRLAPLERQDLSGLVFSGIALRDVSLRGANLEAATFLDCDLTGCDFADANLVGTRFSGSRGSLAHADFGDLSGFVSVQIDSRTVDSAEQFARLLAGAGGRSHQVIGPCATAQQLRALFLKFVRPNGQARRDWLDTRAVLAGKRYTDPSKVLNAAVHAGFLAYGTGRARYERTHSELYADMVGFAKNLRMTPSIRTLLTDTCRVDGCGHAVAGAQSVPR
jgi:hypothetical protein